MSDIQITFFEPQRWLDYKNIRLEALKEEPNAFGSSYEDDIKLTDEEWQHRARQLSEAGDALFFAEHEGHVIGMTLVRFEPHLKTKHVSEVHGVYVNSVFRGMGVGKKLFTALMDYLEKKPEITKVKLGVNVKQTTAIHLYEKFDFKKIGIEEKETFVDGEYQDLYLMEKFLKHD